MDIFTQLHHKYQDGSHDEIVKILSSPEIYDTGDLRIDYTIGIAEIFSGKIFQGIDCLRNMLEKCRNVIVAGHYDSQIFQFMAFASMQTALLADYNISLDLKKMSSIAILAAEETIRYSNLTGNSLLAQEAEKIRNRIFDTPDNFKVLIPETPGILQIEPTNICNLRCKMCPRLKMKRKPENMSFELFVKALDGWSGRYRTLKFTHLVFGEKINLGYSGAVKLFFLGEPLLHPEFDDLIKEGKSRKVLMNIQTNGVLLTDHSIRERLLDADPHAIGVSMDGIAHEDYESVREKGDIRDLKDGISLLVSEKQNRKLKTKIEISTIISSPEDELRIQASSVFKELCGIVDSFRIIPLDKSYSPEYHDGNGNLITYLPEKKRYETNLPVCSEPFNKLNILSDGRVTPCCHDIDGDICLGSIDDNSVDEIWNNEKSFALKEALAGHKIGNYPICLKCRYT